MNTGFKISAFVTISCLALFMGGCASVPMASMEQDVKSKEFAPAPNKAALYIYRNENFGAAIPMNVAVNGRNLGQTAAKTYFRLSVGPGSYKVDSSAENVSTLNLSVEAGKNYFVWQEVKMGMWAARSALHQVDEKTGRDGVMESKQIASSIPDNELVSLDAPPAAAPAVTANGAESVSQKLQELQVLRDDKKITEEEYQKLRAGVIAKYQK